MTEIYACATHGVLSDPAVDRIAASSLREVVLTDSIPLPERKRISKITTLSVAPLIGEAIKRIHRGESVGALFSSEVSLTQEMLLWEDGNEGTLDTRDEHDEGGDDGEPSTADLAGAVPWPSGEPPASPARRRRRHRAARCGPGRLAHPASFAAMGDRPRFAADCPTSRTPR